MYPVHTNTGFSAGAPLYLRKISSRADELVLTSGAKDYEGSLEFNLRWNVYLIRVSFAYSTLSGLRYICGSDIFESNRLGRNDHVFSCGRNYFRERKNDGTKERFVGVSFTASNVFSSIRWLMGMRETIDLLLSSVSIADVKRFIARNKNRGRERIQVAMAISVNFLNYCKIIEILFFIFLNIWIFLLIIKLIETLRNWME